MNLGPDAIRARLPHRDPILLPQEVVVQEVGRIGYSRFRLANDIMVMAGQSQRDFARELFLECAAQTFGVVLGSEATGESAKDERHLLLGFNQVVFDFSKVDPDLELTAHVSLQEASGTTYVAQFRVEQNLVDGSGIHCAASGSLMVMKG